MPSVKCALHRQDASNDGPVRYLGNRQQGVDVGEHHRRVDDDSVGAIASCLIDFPKSSVE
jgi:hypothetical protein